MAKAVFGLVALWTCLSCGKGATDALSSVATVGVSPETVTIPVSRTAQFVATPRDAQGNVVESGSVSWSSSNTAVATVSASGVATALATGTSTVTATSGGKAGSAIVTVPVASIDHIVVTPSAASIASGATQPFAASALDASGNVVPTTLVWASSNTSAATVNASGVATGVGAGLTTISAAIDGVTGKATLAVTTAASCKLVEGTRTVRESALAKPSYLQSVIDPDFGTTITRVTGDPGTAIPVVGGTWGTTVYGNYPKDAVWNADQSLMVLKHTGTAQFAFLFLDGSTYRVLFGRRGPGAVDARWHPTMPDMMLTVDADGTIKHWNVRANTTALKFRPSGYSNASFGSYEGNPSRDGRYVVVQATRNSDNHVVAFAVDVDFGSKAADIDLTAATITDLDWVSISEAGGYVVAYATIDGAVQRTKVWNARTGALVGYWQDYTFGHYDLGVDPSGNEVAFGAVGQAPYAHHFVARRLDTGAITDLTGASVTSYNWHAGTRSTARPGWGYGVTNDRTGFPFDGEIYGIKLDGSRTIERYAHHRSNVTDYDANPFATPSPDGRRLLFSSNWGEASGRPIQTYVADTRQLCPNGLPE